MVKFIIPSLTLLDFRRFFPICHRISTGWPFVLQYEFEFECQLSVNELTEHAKWCALQILHTSDE